MIKTKADLKEYIKVDNALYYKLTLKQRLISRFCKYPEFEIMRFLKCLRYTEYYYNLCQKSKLNLIKAMCYERKKNKIGYKLGIEIGINCFGKGLTIYHGGNIVVNPSARIGENCQLHGGNCIGNNGEIDVSPVIGNNVDIGFGACVIGDVRIADGVKIGSNAVVVKDCIEPDKTIVGIPAKMI